jgi:hypothetical protein
MRHFSERRRLFIIGDYVNCGGKLTGRTPLPQVNVYLMIQRRALAAGFQVTINCRIQFSFQPRVERKRVRG